MKRWNLWYLASGILQVACVVHILLDRFCYNHPNFGLPGLMKYVAISNLAVYILDMFTNGLVTQLLYFNSSYCFLTARVLIHCR